MLLSMTAYGSSTVSHNSAQYLIELYSVNRKGVDFTIHLPTANLWLENELRQYLTSKISRGQVIFKLSLTARSSFSGFDSKQFKSICEELVSLEQSLDDNRAFSLDFIYELAQRQLNSGYQGKDSQFLEVIVGGLDDAFNEFMQMKDFEGQSIKKDFFKRIEMFEGALAEVTKLSADTRVKMAEKIKAVAKTHKVLEDLEKNRFHAEVAFYCDKYDIHEECTRLLCHIQSLRNRLEGKISASGRSMEFVLQEMMRETNTLCAKSPLSSVKAQGVLVKSEIEKFREQLQNIE